MIVSSSVKKRFLDENVDNNPNLIPHILEPLRKYPAVSGYLPRFADFIQHAENFELNHANPGHLAQRLGFGLGETLDLISLVTASGLAKLEWETFCPGCKMKVHESQHLGEVHDHIACNCGWEGDILLDQAVFVSADLRGLRSIEGGQPETAANHPESERTSALALINRPVFRENLGVQVLPPNQSLGVEKLAVLFSDLKGSTALYERMGDGRAYRLVSDHFQVLFDAVEKHGGSAVKTIGDGVMGTFFTPQDALQGITQVVDGMRELNRRAGLTGRTRLRLKLGLHVGSCIVVTLNNRLDYFGTTVNIASRLNNLSNGTDVLVSEAVLQDEAARQLAANMGSVEALSTTLRGLSQPTNLYRIRLN